LMFLRSNGLASFFSLPLYVGFKSFQAMNTFPDSLSAASFSMSKSYSQLTYCHIEVSNV
jgi:hypothetical protein